MMHTNYIVKESPPSAEDFASLRKLIDGVTRVYRLFKSIDARCFGNIYLDSNLVGWSGDWRWRNVFLYSRRHYSSRTSE